MIVPSDAPFIFRVASWPIETLLPLRSPSFTSEVDALIEAEASIQASGEKLSALLYKEVPKLQDRRERAMLLRVRRHLFGSTEPLQRPDISALLAIPGLRDRWNEILRDDEVRQRLAAQRLNLKSIYSTTINQETRGLLQCTSTLRFRKALIAASASAARHWEEVCYSDPQRVTQRLIATLWGYVLRAVGRPTPNSLWAGITLEDFEYHSETEHFTIRETSSEIRVKPNLNVFDKGIRALKAHPDVIEDLRLRYCPCLLEEGDGNTWKYLREQDGSWFIVEITDSGEIRSLRSILERNGPMVAERLAKETGVAKATVLEMVECGVLWPEVDWPQPCADPWEAVAMLAAQLPNTHCSRWEQVITQLRQIADWLSTHWQATHPMEVALRFEEARTIVNNLLASYGIKLEEHEAVLLVDLIAPFLIAVSKALKNTTREAIRRYYAFDRGGLGELLSNAGRQNLRLSFKQDGLLLAGFHSAPLPDLNREGSVTFLAPAGDCLEAEAHQLQDKKTIEKFLAIVKRWTEHLAARVTETTISVEELRSELASEPLPPGAALIRVTFSNDGQIIRVGSISADPSTFYSRFHHLLSTRQNSFGPWLLEAVSQIQRIADVRLSDFAFYGSHDRNAAVRPRLTNCMLDPFGEDRRSYEASVDNKGRLKLHELGVDKRIVPLTNSAVDLSTADPYSAWLQRHAQLFGRPSLLRPLSRLKAEEEFWRHLPRLEQDRDIVISPERWYLPSSEISELVTLPPFERFVAWRKLVNRLRLPALVYSRQNSERTEALLPSDSTLAVELFARAVRLNPGAISLQEAFADTDQLWLRDASGNHYVTEIALAWAGELGFWQDLAPELL